MRTTLIERRHHWHALSRQAKHERLEEMRARHQRQVELEMLRLQQSTR